MSGAGFCVLGGCRHCRATDAGGWTRIGKPAPRLTRGERPGMDTDRNAGAASPGGERRGVNADRNAGAASPGDKSPGWNYGKTAEAVSTRRHQSAQADFAWFQPRIHSPLGPGTAAPTRFGGAGRAVERGRGRADTQVCPYGCRCASTGTMRGRAPARYIAPMRAAGADLARESAKADFVLLLPRVHSPGYRLSSVSPPSGPRRRRGGRGYSSPPGRRR
jgi:hypothetical protein